MNSYFILTQLPRSQEVNNFTYKIVESHGDTQEMCKNLPKRSCSLVPRKTCESVPKKKCGYVPKQICKSVPKKQCRNVPRFDAL